MHQNCRERGPTAPLQKRASPARKSQAVLSYSTATRPPPIRRLNTLFISRRPRPSSLSACPKGRRRTLNVEEESHVPWGLTSSRLALAPSALKLSTEPCPPISKRKKKRGQRSWSFAHCFLYDQPSCSLFSPFHPAEEPLHSICQVDSLDKKERETTQKNN